MRRVPILRMLAAVIGIAAVFLGWQSLKQAQASFARFQTQSQVLPLDIAVDLSQPSTYHAQFKQTWQACHGQRLTLRFADDQVEPELTTQDLKSLLVTWEVSDSEGAVITEGRVLGTELQEDELENGRIDLAYMFPFELGDYAFTCEVLGAVPALAEVDQRLVSEYRPCGLERLPAEVMRLFAYGAFFIGGCTLLPVTLISIRGMMSPNTVHLAEPRDERHRP